MIDNSINTQWNVVFVSYEDVVNYLNQVASDYSSNLFTIKEKRSINTAAWNPLPDGKWGFLKGDKRIPGSTELENLLGDEREYITRIEPETNKVVNVTDAEWKFMAKPIEPNFDDVQKAKKFNLIKVINNYTLIQKINLLTNIDQSEPEIWTFEMKEKPFVLRRVLSSTIESLIKRLWGGEKNHSRAEDLAKELSSDSLKVLKNLMKKEAIRANYIDHRWSEGKDEYDEVLEVVERALIPETIQWTVADSLANALQKDQE